jgi:hypothetical protein
MAKILIYRRFQRFVKRILRVGERELGHGSGIIGFDCNGNSAAAS